MQVLVRVFCQFSCVHFCFIRFHYSVLRYALCTLLLSESERIHNFCPCTTNTVCLPVCPLGPFVVCSTGCEWRRRLLFGFSFVFVILFWARLPLSFCLCAWRHALVVVFFVVALYVCCWASLFSPIIWCFFICSSHILADFVFSYSPIIDVKGRVATGILRRVQLTRIFLRLRWAFGSTGWRKRGGLRRCKEKKRRSARQEIVVVVGRQA